MAYLERDAGRRIYFEDYGAGGSAVVLVHGWGASLRTWDFNLNAIRAAGHRETHRGPAGPRREPCPTPAESPTLKTEPIP